METAVKKRLALAGAIGLAITGAVVLFYAGLWMSHSLSVAIAFTTFGIISVAFIYYFVRALIAEEGEYDENVED